MLVCDRRWRGGKLWLILLIEGACSGYCKVSIGGRLEGLMVRDRLQRNRGCELLSMASWRLMCDRIRRSRCRDLEVKVLIIVVEKV